MPQHSQRQSCRGKFAELDEDEYEKNKTTSNFFIHSFDSFYIHIRFY